FCRFDNFWPALTVPPVALRLASGADVNVKVWADVLTAVAVQAPLNRLFEAPEITTWLLAENAGPLLSVTVTLPPPSAVKVLMAAGLACKVVGRPVPTVARPWGAPSSPEPRSTVASWALAPVPKMPIEA